MFDLTVFIVACSVILASIVSARLACVAAKRWSLTKNDENLTIGLVIVSVGAAAVLAGCATAAAIGFGGLSYGIGAVVLTLPGVGFAWIGLVGGNKVVERILSGLLNKIDSKGF